METRISAGVGGLSARRIADERPDQFGIRCQGFRKMKISGANQMSGPDKKSRHNRIRRRPGKPTTSRSRKSGMTIICFSRVFSRSKLLHRGFRLPIHIFPMAVSISCFNFATRWGVLPFKSRTTSRTISCTGTDSPGNTAPDMNRSDNSGMAWSVFWNIRSLHLRSLKTFKLWSQGSDVQNTDQAMPELSDGFMSRPCYLKVVRSGVRKCSGKSFCF